MKLPWTDYKKILQKQLIKLLKEAIIHVVLYSKTNNVHDEICDYVTAELSVYAFLFSNKIYLLLIPQEFG